MFDMIWTFFTTLTIFGFPLLLIGYGIWKLFDWLRNSRPVNPREKYEVPKRPATWTVTEKQFEPYIRKLETEAIQQKPRAFGERIYRVYRSIDQSKWVECDVALTERSACNYARYIKDQNTYEYVKCEDPDGKILFYE